jgi:hypothetical protein
MRRDDRSVPVVTGQPPRRRESAHGEDEARPHELDLAQQVGLELHHLEGGGLRLPGGRHIGRRRSYLGQAPLAPARGGVLECAEEA